MLTKAAVA